MISTQAISDLFEKVAKVHTGIGHNPANGIIRFYSYNSDEAIAKERDVLSYPCLGLGNDMLVGRYHKQAGATGDSLSISIDIVKQVEQSNYPQEYNAYESMKVIQDDIVTWLQEVGSTELRYQYPAVCQLDLDSIDYKKIGPVLTNAFGWRMTVKVKDSLLYDSSTNPLNNMTP